MRLRARKTQEVCLLIRSCPLANLTRKQRDSELVSNLEDQVLALKDYVRKLEAACGYANLPDFASSSLEDDAAHTVDDSQTSAINDVSSMMWRMNLHGSGETSFLGHLVASVSLLRTMALRPRPSGLSRKRRVFKRYSTCSDSTSIQSIISSLLMSSKLSKRLKRLLTASCCKYQSWQQRVFSRIHRGRCMLTELRLS